MRWFRDLRVSRKLLVVICVHLLHAAILLLVTAYGMKALSASRAYVEGEGLWSKAQKEGTLHLIAYSESGDESLYEAFLVDIDVNLGDRQAREELNKKDPDMAVVRDGFIRGKLDPGDIDDIAWLYRNFGGEAHLAKAIGIWEAADAEMASFIAIGGRMHDAVQANDTAAVARLKAEVYASDARLTVLEDEFSHGLGDGVRWLTDVVNLAAIGLTILFVGAALVISAAAARQITRSLDRLNQTAQAVAAGDLGRRVGLDGRDEVAMVGRTFDAMAGRVSAMMAEVREAADAKATAAAQAREIQRLGELDAFRMQFINNAAHELRTPLTPLRMQLHVLAQQRAASFTPQEQRGFAMLQRNVDRLSTLVDDLLEVSRYQSGHMAVEPIAADLHKVLHEAVETFQPAAAAKQVRLVLDAKGDPGGRFDARRITQVVYNLLSNALKFTPPEGRIDVTCGSDATHWTVQVRDSGQGIRPELIPKLFQPFSQVHEANPGQTGAGLGLFICRALVELHGGTIAAESKGLGGGTTFTVRLPRQPPVEPGPA